MDSQNHRLKVLLIDSNALITRFLIINLEHNGCEAPVALSVQRAEEVAEKTRVDAIAVASPELVNTREDIARLRRAFSCPVLVYNAGGCDGDGELHSIADGIVQLREPADFLKSIEETIAFRH